MPLALTAAILHLGLMDGSAGIAVSENSFITCSDEKNWITRYSVAGGVGKRVLDLDREKDWFAAVEKSDGDGFKEADIESAARVGDRVFWISSHACAENDVTKKPEVRPERQVLFATRLEKKDGTLLPVPDGKVYRDLLGDLLNAKGMEKYGLAAAAKEMPKSGPTADKPDAKPGLNIECLCTAEDRQTLFIGFRNPVPKGKAILVPLLNAPALVAKESAAKAQFGPIVELDLGGLGLRDMVWWRGTYLLIGGHFDNHLDKKTGKPKPGVPVPKLFRWDGVAGHDPSPLKVSLDFLNPEALVVFSDGRVLILSDDGGFQKGTAQEKTYFRSVWLTGEE